MAHVRIIGLKKLENDMDSAARRFPPEMKRKIRKASAIVVGEAQKQFQGSRTRSKYKIAGGRRVKRKTPRAVTAPPDKLGIFEGTYRKQISYTVRGARRTLNSEVGPVSIPYARIHEFGGRGMPKRPVLGPAVEEANADVFRIMGQTFKVVR